MVVAELKIVIGDDESMQITGPLHDKEWCLKCLEMASESIKRQNNGGSIIMPHDYIDKKVLSIVK